MPGSKAQASGTLEGKFYSHFTDEESEAPRW